MGTREQAAAALDAMLGMALVVAFLMRNRNIRICRIRASRPTIAAIPDWRLPGEPAA